MIAVLIALLSGAAFGGEMDAAWSSARVGDSLRYRVERRVVDTDADGKPHEDRLDMTVDAEVVSTAGGKVWVRLAARRPDGSRFDDRWRGKDLLLPMPVKLKAGKEPEPPPFVREETVEAGGRTWPCRVERRSNPRKPEGTFVEYWTVEDPDLYLTQGVVRLRVQFQEAGRTGTLAITFQRSRRGAPGAAGSVPKGLALYLEDGMWNRTALSAVKGSSSRQRTFAGAGWILDKKESSVGRMPPMAEWRTRRLVDLMDGMSGNWRRYEEKSTLEESQAGEPLKLKTKDVRALRRTWAWTGRKDGVRSENIEYYAADPWDPGLEGLSYDARLSRMRVLGGRAGKPVELERLEDWGRGD